MIKRLTIALVAHDAMKHTSLNGSHGIGKTYCHIA